MVINICQSNIIWSGFIWSSLFLPQRKL
jgi:hypothetical protein